MHKFFFLQNYIDSFKHLIGSKIPVHLRIINIFFILLPFTLVTGPFLPDLFLTIIAIYFLIISTIDKLIHYYKNLAVYLFLAFYIWIVVSGLLSDHPYQSLIDYNGPIFFIRYLFFTLGIAYLLNKNTSLIKIFCIHLLLLLIFVVIDGYVMWSTGTNLFGFQSPSSRVTGIFNGEEILGHFLSHTIPLAFALCVFVFGIEPKKVILYMLLLVISEILIFVSNDRAGFLKIFQFTVLLIFLSNHFKIFRIISFVLSLLIISLIIQFSGDSKERYSKTVDQVSSTKVPFMPWTPGHEEHFKIALDMFKKSPITGQGPQAFRIYCDATEYIKGCTNHPHNYYFQTIGELGIVGFVILTIAFIYVTQKLFVQFYNLWIRRNNTAPYLSDHLVSLYSLAFILLWPLIPHQSFYNNWLNVYYFLPFGFIYYFLDAVSENNKLNIKK